MQVIMKEDGELLKISIKVYFPNPNPDKLDQDLLIKFLQLYFWM